MFLLPFHHSICHSYFNTWQSLRRVDNQKWFKKENDFYARSQNSEKRLLALSCMSVCPSVSPSTYVNQLVCHCTDFHKIWYLNIFPKSGEKIPSFLKSDKNNKYFTWRPLCLSLSLFIYIYIFIYLSHLILIRTITVSDKIIEIKHFVLNNFFSLENHVIWNIPRKNVLEPGSPQMTTWCVRFARWVALQEWRQTPIIFNTHCSSKPTMVTQTLRLYCMSCFSLRHT
jgi:hypothetical protein